LATGKPVVSVWSREVERFSSVVRIARTQEGFLHEIDDALANDTVEAREERLGTVAKMSWDARVDEVMAQVEATMGKSWGSSPT
ncbi:MAG: hypothetical protein ABI134_28970, partial [Byssovorax sp.]